MLTLLCLQQSTHFYKEPRTNTSEADALKLNSYLATLGRN